MGLSSQQKSLQPTRHSHYSGEQPLATLSMSTFSRLLGEERLCELASQKDLGFDKKHLADALRAFSRLDRDLFEVDDDTYRSIRTWTISGRERLLMRGIEHERGSGPERANEGRFDISDF